MDIPQQFRSKMGAYDIQIDGIKIKATLVNPNFSLKTAISEFKSHIEPDLPVVGVDFKHSLSKPGLLLLYANGRCLIIQLSLIIKFPKSLGLFLSDSSICFVGLKIDACFERIRSKASSGSAGKCDTVLTGKGAEIRRLAAGVLKNPPLTKCVDVFDLATKSGIIEMKMADEASKPSDWNAKFFSEEEMLYAIHNVYYCHEMGKKLLSML